MLGIIFSEMDFDYELQMLVKSFFPGQECLVTTDQGKGSELEVALVLALGREEIRGKVMAGHMPERPAFLRMGIRIGTRIRISPAIPTGPGIRMN